MARSNSRARGQLRTVTALRVRLGISQSDLANQAGLHQSQLSLYENGYPILEDHAKALLQVFQNNPQTSALANSLSYEDLSDFWVNSYQKTVVQA